MIKYTRHNLKKVEDIFQDLSFRIRYEKGNFQSGYCIVDQKDIIVINKFFDTEGRINCLLEIIDTLNIDKTLLSETNVKTLEQVLNVIEATKIETKTTEEPETYGSTEESILTAESVAAETADDSMEPAESINSDDRIDSVDLID